MPTFITLSSYPFCFPGGHSEKRIKKGHRLTAVSLFAHFAETLAHMAVNPIFSSFLIQPWLKQGGGANRSSLNLGHLLDDSVHQLLRLLVNAGEIGIQFPAQQQSII